MLAHLLLSTVRTLPHMPMCHRHTTVLLAKTSTLPRRRRRTTRCFRRLISHTTTTNNCTCIRPRRMATARRNLQVTGRRVLRMGSRRAAAGRGRVVTTKGITGKGWRKRAMEVRSLSNSRPFNFLRLLGFVSCFVHQVFIIQLLE